MAPAILTLFLVSSHLQTARDAIDAFESGAAERGEWDGCLIVATFLESKI